MVKESEVDAWTSNGRGVYMIGEPTPEQKAAVEQFNKEHSQHNSAFKSDITEHPEKDNG